MAKLNTKITCKELAQQIKDQVKEEIMAIGDAPYLAIVSACEDAASQAYVKGKMKDGEEVGIAVGVFKITPEMDKNDLWDMIMALNRDINVDGIIVQLPLPDHFKDIPVTDWIAKEKDVDGFRQDSPFEPCTPKGCIKLLTEIYRREDFSGLSAVVLGRSDIVGRPLAKMLLDRNATVTVCHSKTAGRDKDMALRNADIIVSAVGKINSCDYFTNFYGENQIVLDVGINRDSSGKLRGDVSDLVRESVRYCTPVPGGIGLLTRAMLMRNTLDAYMMRWSND